MDLKINERWVSVSTVISGKIGGRLLFSFFFFNLMGKNCLSASGEKLNVGRGHTQQCCSPSAFALKNQEESSITL